MAQCALVPACVCRESRRFTAKYSKIQQMIGGLGQERAKSAAVISRTYSGNSGGKSGRDGPVPGESCSARSPLCVSAIYSKIQQRRIFCASEQVCKNHARVRVYS